MYEREIKMWKAESEELKNNYVQEKSDEKVDEFKRFKEENNMLKKDNLPISEQVKMSGKKRKIRSLQVKLLIGLLEEEGYLEML